MFRTRTVLLSSSLMILLAACSEGFPTDPATSIPQSASLVATSIPGVAFNSASCALANSTTGEVRCSWDISNANGTSLNYEPEAYMTITYNCLDNKGEIRSSGTTSRWSSLYYPNVTSTSITGTNQQLGTAVPPTGGTRSNKRWNACKTSQQLQITGYTMQYWDIYISSSDGRACLGSDDRFGCLVA